MPTPERGRAPARLAGVLWAATAIPPILIARAVAHYGVDLPFFDEWDFAPTVAAAFTGRLAPSALWAPHNEHRVVLPRLLILGLARLSGWNVRLEMAACYLIALATLVLLIGLVRRTVGPHAPAAVPWLVAAASWLVFSLGAWENWTWGWQASVFLNVLAAVCAAWAVGGERATWPRLLVALAAGMAAALSFAAGLVLLAILPLAALLSPFPRSRRWPAAAFAFAVAAATWALYLTGLPRTTPPSGTGRLTPYGWYALAYLGSALSGGSPLAALAWGALGLMAFTGSATWLWLRVPAARPGVLPWLVLGGYVVLNAAVAASGRAAWGIEQALASRYVSLTALFWISVAVVTTLALASIPTERWASTRAVAPLLLACGVLALAAEGYVRSWELGHVALRSHRSALRRARPCVLMFATAPDDCLRLVYHTPATLRIAAGELAALHLGPFRASARP